VESDVYECLFEFLCTLCQKNDTDVAHYKINAHQPILVIFGRDVTAVKMMQLYIMSEYKNTTQSEVAHYFTSYQ